MKTRSTILLICGLLALFSLSDWLASGVAPLGMALAAVVALLALVFTRSSPDRPAPIRRLLCRVGLHRMRVSEMEDVRAFKEHCTACPHKTVTRNI